ncbi:MAG: FG-GAP-like repeat-containing protein [Haloarculaceae archaeon]
MPYRIGFVGTGATPDDPDEEGYAMAYRHAAAYDRIDDCELVACADIVRENAEQFSERFDVPGVFEDYETMLAEAEPDVVSVCVPPAVHADIVEGCAEYGDLEAVHCEKPMATTWRACQEMCEACEDAGIKLTFNHQRRTGPIYRRAKQLLDDGGIGDLERIEWSAKNLYDAGTHMFDLSAFYADQSPVEWVLAGLDYSEENRQFGTHNENQAVAQWQYESGVYGTATTGRSSDATGARLRLVGSEGTIEVAPDDGPPLRLRNGRTLGWKTIDVGETQWGNRSYVTYPGYVRWGLEAAAEQLGERLPVGPSGGGYPSHIDRAIESVVDAVREDEESELAWRNAIQATEVIFAAWESVRRRERVEPPLEIDDNPLEAMVEEGQLPVGAAESSPPTAAPTHGTDGGTVRSSGDANGSASGVSDEAGDLGDPPEFRHERIDADPPSGRLFLCLPTDLTGNGRPDLVVGGLGANPIEAPLPGVSFDRHTPAGSIVKKLGLETDLFWYENPGWERHAVTGDSALRLLGGTVVDFDGSGRTDLAVGQGYGQSAIYWFERPEDPRDEWTRRVVRSDYAKYHDLAFGDVDDDGEPELAGLSQGGDAVFYYDVPDDPYDTPWPDETLHVVDEGVSLEGLEIVDVDGDGDTEIVAGPNVYHRVDADTWEREPIVTGWDWTRTAVADLDGDGDLEVVLSEGDSPALGDDLGRVSWFDPPDWEEHRLHDGLHNPHTVEVADFDGNGHPDVYVAEMGIGGHDDASHLLFRNRGGGEFVEHVVDRGTPTHEARAVDLTGNGRPDVVGKSYQPDPHVDVWYNEG